LFFNFYREIETLSRYSCTADRNRDATFRQFSATDVESRTQVPDSMLTGVGLRKLITLDESFPSVGGSEPMAGVRGTVSKGGSAARQKEGV